MKLRHSVLGCGHGSSWSIMDGPRTIEVGLEIARFVNGAELSEPRALEL